MEGIRHIDDHIPEESIEIGSILGQIETQDIPVSFSDRKQYGDFINDILLLKSVRIERNLIEEEMLDFLLIDFFQKKGLIEPKLIDVILIAEGTCPLKK